MLVGPVLGAVSALATTVAVAPAAPGVTVLYVTGSAMDSTDGVVPDTFHVTWQPC